MALVTQAYLELDRGYRSYWTLSNSIDDPPGEQDVLSVPKLVPRVFYEEKFGHFLFYGVERLQGGVGEAAPELIDIQELDIGPAAAKARCLTLLRHFDAPDARARWIRRASSDEWLRLED